MGMSVRLLGGLGLRGGGLLLSVVVGVSGMKVLVICKWLYRN